MLVLKRKSGQQIRLGNDVIITIVQTTRGWAKVGIEAPRHIEVVRGELADRDSEAAEATT